MQLNRGEFSMLCHLARHPGIILPRDQLYAAAYRENHFSSNTVPNTICQIRNKIEPYLMEADKCGLLAAFYLELTTGLRRGELLALLWTGLDVENRIIFITKQVNRIQGELMVSQPKTQNSVRVLPVS